MLGRFNDVHRDALVDRRLLRKRHARIQLLDYAGTGYYVNTDFIQLYLSCSQCQGTVGIASTAAVQYVNGGPNWGADYWEHYSGAAQFLAGCYPASSTAASTRTATTSVFLSNGRSTNALHRRRLSSSSGGTT